MMITSATRAPRAALVALGLALCVCGCASQGQTTDAAVSPPAASTGVTPHQGPADPGRTTGAGAHTGHQTHASGPSSPSSTPTSDQGGSTPSTYDDTSGTTAHAPKNQHAVLAHLPGPSHSSACVAVGNRTNVRAGELAMGNFALARQNFSAAKSAYQAAPSFFYVIPGSRSAKNVTVVASRLGASGAPVRVHSDQVEQAAQWNYFPIQIQLPSSGTWRFRVSAGVEHGCFDASFTT